MGLPSAPYALAKNRSTIIRDAQEAIIVRGLKGHEQDFLDSLYVMETAMQHFYVKAIVTEQNNGKADVIDANFLQAVEIAAKIAPYRHARLSAVKVAGDPNAQKDIEDSASLEELKAMVEFHLERVAPLLDLRVIPINGTEPVGGIAHREVPRRMNEAAVALPWRPQRPERGRNQRLAPVLDLPAIEPPAEDDQPQVTLGRQME